MQHCTPAFWVTVTIVSWQHRVSCGSYMYKALSRLNDRRNTAWQKILELSQYWRAMCSRGWRWELSYTDLLLCAKGWIWLHETDCIIKSKLPSWPTFCQLSLSMKPAMWRTMLNFSSFISTQSIVSSASRCCIVGLSLLFVVHVVAVSVACAHARPVSCFQWVPAVFST